MCDFCFVFSFTHRAITDFHSPEESDEATPQLGHHQAGKNICECAVVVACVSARFIPTFSTHLAKTQVSMLFRETNLYNLRYALIHDNTDPQNTYSKRCSFSTNNL